MSRPFHPPRKQHFLSYQPIIIGLVVPLLICGVLYWGIDSRPDTSPTPSLPPVEKQPHIPLQAVQDQEMHPSTTESDIDIENQNTAVVSETTGTTIAQLPAESISSLKRETADWRFVGFVKSNTKQIALIQRMREPLRVHKLFPGQSLQGVTLVEIQKDSIKVSMDQDETTISLATGAAFDLENVQVPDELSDDPALLGQALFSQTIGQYMLDHPEFTESLRSETDQQEVLEQVSHALGWTSGFAIDMEEFVSALANALDQSSQAGAVTSPENYPLNESDRSRILGLEIYR